MVKQAGPASAGPSRNEASTVNDREVLLDVLQRYFDGLYRGNADLLRGVFHPQARLFGEVKGEILLRELEPYLQLVASRLSPVDNGEAQRMKVLALQIHGAIALATVQCDLLGFNYVDQLSLLKQDGRWTIVNKLYTHLEL
ncbi:nuclear transport factor 2 family protein [Variovorax paradoxus]|nr:nuclear transport factor 2 family protein [Variovorax paradoxus]